jgi:hypothetical protein
MGFYAECLQKQVDGLSTEDGKKGGNGWPRNDRIHDSTTQTY